MMISSKVLRFLLLGAVALASAAAVACSNEVDDESQAKSAAAFSADCMDWPEDWSIPIEHRVDQYDPEYPEVSDWWRRECMSVELGIRDSLNMAQSQAEQDNMFAFRQNMSTAGEYRWVYSQMRCDVFWPMDEFYGQVSPRCIEKGKETPAKPDPATMPADSHAEAPANPASPPSSTGGAAGGSDTPSNPGSGSAPTSPVIATGDQYYGGQSGSPYSKWSYRCADGTAGMMAGTASACAALVALRCPSGGSCSFVGD